MRSHEKGRAWAAPRERESKTCSHMTHLRPRRGRGTLLPTTLSQLQMPAPTLLSPLSNLTYLSLLESSMPWRKGQSM